MLCAPTRLGGDLLTGLLFGLDSICELHTGHGLQIYLKSIFGGKLPTHRKQPFCVSSSKTFRDAYAGFSLKT